jgi:Pyruvate/2-oxoacid:ferredoxin oxidoreductase gamma subunit
VAGLVLALVATTAAAAEWETVGTDDDGNVYSVDVSRVTRDGGTVSIAVRTEYAKPRRIDAVEADVFVALDQMVVDCGKVSFAVQSRTLVAADGTEIPRGSTARANLRFRVAASGSMSESIVRFACGPAAGGKD